MPEKLSKKCSQHQGRGKAPRFCWECREAKKLAEAAEETKVPVRVRTLKTRKAGLEYVEQLYRQDRDATYHEENLADAAANDEYTKAIAPLVAPYLAIREEKLMANAERGTRLREELSERYRIHKENLEKRCHIGWGDGKECGKYLDYEGRCPTHGYVPAPGTE